MEALIHPDIGLSFWTIVCFVLLLLILKRTAWKPLMDAINEREEGLRRTMESANQAQKEAEKIRDELNSRLADLKSEIKEQLEEARKTASKEKEAMIADARKSAASIIAAAKKEIEAERAAALKDMKKKVSRISMMAAGKILQDSITGKENDALVEKYISEAEKSNLGFKDGSNN